MPGIDDYIDDPQRALIAAASDPILRTFLEPGDLEPVDVDLGHGSQGQVQALSRGSVGKVIQRIFARSRQGGVDMKYWVCSTKEFNLCARLDTPPGKLMRDLNAFLRRKTLEPGFVAGNLLAAFGTTATMVVLGQFLAVLSAVALIDNRIVELCDCPRPKGSED